MLNTPAPLFTLYASTGREIRLADLKNAYVVLIFYPSNDSPTCNQQLSETNIALQEYISVPAQVFGVNTAPPEKHKAYCTRRNLEFPILSDPSGQVAKAYKAKFPLLPIIRRTVVAIDPDGIIFFYRRGFPPKDMVLNALRARIAERKLSEPGSNQTV